MTKEFNFKLTLDEANIIMTCLKKAPMESVEHIVVKMNNQYSSQVTETPPVVTHAVVEKPKANKKRA